MTKPILYLFPDTNLFIQCRPLQQIDWSKWKNFKEIHLIVCRPIQREIDNQKNRGNDRVGQRARKIYSLFRRIALGKNKYELISGTTPQVKLYLESPSKPSTELEQRLDYSKADDELVGCLYRFRQEHPEEDARLLTHDAGPIMTARSLDLPFIAVDDTWIVPPENTESEREIARLTNEINQLKKTKPQFQIRCINEHDAEVEELKLEYHSYDSLTDEERLEFMQLIKSEFPPISDFGLRKPSKIEPKTALDHLIRINQVYTPASEGEIAKYKDQDYPGWIESCEGVLSNLHVTLQCNFGQPSFRFAMTNKGNQPGKNVLVVFKAKGKIKICPLYDKDSEDSANKKEAPCLPLPPRPPQGKWEFVTSPFQRMQDALENHLSDPKQSFHTLLRPALDIPSLDKTLTTQRDSDAFYYKSGRPKVPSESFSLEL